MAKKFFPLVHGQHTKNIGQDFFDIQLCACHLLAGVPDSYRFIIGIGAICMAGCQIPGESEVL